MHDTAPQKNSGFGSTFHWILSLIIVIIIILSSLLAFLYHSRQQRIAQTTATAMAVQATQTATTAQATQTALRLAADTDRDGLKYFEEEQLGTDPDRKDTDRDGLSDKAEVEIKTDPKNDDTDGDGLKDGVEKQHRTDPLQSDSDQDGLPDGVEVNQNINPTNSDTDGDGETDNIDQTPNQAATPTATSTATSTPTPSVTSTATPDLGATVTARLATATIETYIRLRATATTVASQRATATTEAKMAQIKAQLETAKNYVQDKDYERAILEYEKLLKVVPSDKIREALANVHYQNGRRYYTQGWASGSHNNYEQSSSYFRQATDEFQKAKDLTTSQSKTQVYSQWSELAVGDYYLSEGLAALQQTKPDEAIRNFNQALIEYEALFKIVSSENSQDITHKRVSTVHYWIGRSYLQRARTNRNQQDIARAQAELEWLDRNSTGENNELRIKLEDSIALVLREFNR